MNRPRDAAFPEPSIVVKRTGEDVTIELENSISRIMASLSFQEMKELQGFLSRAIHDIERKDGDLFILRCQSQKAKEFLDKSSMNDELIHPVRLRFIEGRCSISEPVYPGASLLEELLMKHPIHRTLIEQDFCEGFEFVKLPDERKTHGK
jgi:hypothetical protein